MVTICGTYGRSMLLRSISAAQSRALFSLNTRILNIAPLIYLPVRYGLLRLSVQRMGGTLSVAVAPKRLFHLLCPVVAFLASNGHFAYLLCLYFELRLIIMGPLLAISYAFVIARRLLLQAVISLDILLCFWFFQILQLEFNDFLPFAVAAV
jgi:hypothetical protein